MKNPKNKMTYLKNPMCPKHEGEILRLKDFIAKYPGNLEGIPLPLLHCEKDNKYYNGKELVSARVAARDYINKKYNENYALSAIEVLSLEEMSKQLNKK